MSKYFTCWIAAENCCGEVMRGPNSNSKDKINEEIVNVSTKCDTKYGNELQANYPASCSRTVSNANSKKENEDGKPIWKVGRILIDSLSKGKMRRTKIFGAALEDLPLNCQGIPTIVQRLCYHLEHYGLNEPELFVCDKKYNKLLEKLKISFDRAGDADLESCENVGVVAALLKLWLHDLPYPLISQKIDVRLRIIFEKYNRKEVYDLNDEICNVLVKCSTLNLGVLFTVVRLLHCYVTKWYPSSHVDQVPEMFAKLLLENIEAESVVIITTLIHNFREIFNERVLEMAFKSYNIRHKKNRDSNNMSKIDVPNVLSCGNSPLSVDKLSRSNSEEKLDLPNCRDRKSSLKNVVVKIRRVSSEEDFRGFQHYRCPADCRFIDVSIGRENDSKLANVSSNRDNNLACEQDNDEPVVDECQKMMCPSDADSEVLVAPPPLTLNEDFRLREEIRNEERFTSQFNAYRNTGRKKRAIHHSHNVVPSMQTVFDGDFRYTVPQLEELFNDNAYERYLETSTCLEQNSRPVREENDSCSISSTSSGYFSGCPSFVKILSSPESVQRSIDRFEPSTHHRSWIYPHQHPYLKLQNSNYQLKEGSSSHSMHLSHIDSKILQVNKRLQWLKKRMKHFERDYEGKYGDSPTIMNKMSHPEYKQMSMTIICLKQNLKQLRKEANESFSTHRLLTNSNQNDTNVVTSITNKQKAYEEAEKQMREKRLDSERPQCIEDMTYEQLQDEKVSIQKELFNLENMFGQIDARKEDVFEPIYSRFRSVKRLLAKSSASLKLKGTMTDLATIMENETMEFDNNFQTMISNETKPSVSPCQSVCNVSINDFRVDNINELSSPELMLAYKTTKEERKKLRNRISMYEQEAENNTTNDSKHCIHSLRCRYKNTKAKLKLLEALLMKTK